VDGDRYAEGGAWYGANRGGRVEHTPEPEVIADKLDELVEPAGEPENAVLVDNARLVRWAGPAFALFSLVLLPWTVYLGYSLPSRQVSSHYDIAWTGFDVILLVVLAGTAYFALRRSRYLAIAAASAATLLVVDAWFDVLTSPPGGQLMESLALAVLVELPLASLCVWLSHHTQQLCERRMVLLLGRYRRRARTRAKQAIR
jgi:hypothetical protein